MARRLWPDKPHNSLQCVQGFKECNAAMYQPISNIGYHRVIESPSVHLAYSETKHAVFNTYMCNSNVSQHCFQTEAEECRVDMADMVASHALSSFHKFSRQTSACAVSCFTSEASEASERPRKQNCGELEQLETLSCMNCMRGAFCLLTCCAMGSQCPLVDKRLLLMTRTVIHRMIQNGTYCDIFNYIQINPTSLGHWVGQGCKFQGSHKGPDHCRHLIFLLLRHCRNHFRHLLHGALEHIRTPYLALLGMRKE